MTNLTKNVGTVTLTGAAEKVTLPAAYGWVWVKNMSEGDIFAGLSEDISEGADGVMVIPSGECGRIQTDGFFSVYLLGSGNVQIVGQNYADCPFKAGAKGGELPVASTDTLGGVMVDGTSITADEQGVIRAVGGGGLTLLGRYSNKISTETTIGTISDIPEGTILVFISTSVSNNFTGLYMGSGIVPSMISGYASGNSTACINGALSSGSLIQYSLRIENDGTNIKFYSNNDFGTYLDIYKLEV